VLKHMDSEDSIERVVFPGKPLLAIGDDHRQTIALGDLSGELARGFQGDVLTTRFELNMRSGTRPDLQRSKL